jgi:putative transposase
VKKRWKEVVAVMISSNEIRPSTAGTVLHITRQSFYYERRQTARRLRVDESEKRKLILELAGENITYGYRRIRALLRRQGVFISRNRVRRIMGEMHLLSVSAGPEFAEQRQEC